MNYATDQMPANLIVSGLSTLWWHYHCGSTCAGFKSCRSPDHCPSPNRETRFRNQISTDPGTLAFPTPADKQSCTKHFSLDSVLSISLRVPAVLNKLFPFRFCWGRTSFLAWTALVAELFPERVLRLIRGSLQCAVRGISFSLNASNYQGLSPNVACWQPVNQYQRSLNGNDDRGKQESRNGSVAPRLPH